MSFASTSSVSSPREVCCHAGLHFCRSDVDINMQSFKTLIKINSWKKGCIKILIVGLLIELKGHTVQQVAVNLKIVLFLFGIWKYFDSRDVDPHLPRALTLFLQEDFHKQGSSFPTSKSVFGFKSFSRCSSCVFNNMLLPQFKRLWWSGEALMFWWSHFQFCTCWCVTGLQEHPREPEEAGEEAGLFETLFSSHLLFLIPLISWALVA